MEETAKRSRLALLAAALFLALTACAAGGGNGDQTTSAQTSVEQTSLETTSENTSTGEERMIEVRRIASGSSGQGETRPRVLVAPSLEALQAELGGNLDLRRSLRSAESTVEPDAASGGAYVAVFWGEKNTGGYAVEVESARVEDERVVVELALRSPPEGALVTQALTYPYAVAVLENLDLSGKEFVFVDQNGRELDWPARTTNS